MRLLNIASGSSGNATYVGDQNTHLLIDAGISRKRIVSGLSDADLSLKDLDAILVTHEHMDHISSLGVLLRSREIPVYATQGTIDGILRCGQLGAFDRELLHPIRAGEAFQVKDLQVLPLSIPHDAAEPVCFRIDGEKASAAAVTDLGEADEELVRSLEGLDLLLLEANHDVRMLQTGPYPYPLKLRISGRFGHLSNEASGMLLARLLHDNLRHVLLGHISKENNTRDLAQMAVENEVNAFDCPYRSGDFDIRTLSQNLPSEILEV